MVAPGNTLLNQEFKDKVEKTDPTAPDNGGKPKTIEMDIGPFLSKILKENDKKVMVLIATAINKNNQIILKEINKNNEKVIIGLMEDLHKSMIQELNDTFETLKKDINQTVEDQTKAYIVKINQREIMDIIKTDLLSKIENEFKEAKMDAKQSINEFKAKYLSNISPGNRGEALERWILDMDTWRMWVNNKIGPGAPKTEAMGQSIQDAKPGP